MVHDGGRDTSLGSYSTLTKVLEYTPATALQNDVVHAVALNVTDATGVSSGISWSFRVQIYPDMAANFTCTECHTTYPAAHSMDEL